MAGQSNLVAAVRASRKRRGVPEQQEDEDLLNLNAECDEETEAGADFTLPGSHVQTASGRIWTAWFTCPNCEWTNMDASWAK